MPDSSHPSLPPALEDALACIYWGDPKERDTGIERLIVENPEHAASIRSRLEELRSIEAETVSSIDDADPQFRQVQFVGRYRIIETLGEGGMGTVYLAEQDEPVRRRVALKLIKLGMDSKQVIGRFESERQMLAIMDHPNIAKVLDAGTTQSGQPYFALEHVPGVSITDYCNRNRVDLNGRLDLFRQVCNGVHHAHQKGIIHRDLKPGNILVRLSDGAPMPKIIDFGVAKALNYQLTESPVFTHQGQIVGTPDYMSPEQAEMTGLSVDTRTDIYSLGVLLYELLTGTVPFPAHELRQLGALELQRRIRETTPEKPSKRITTTLGETVGSAEPPSGEFIRSLRGELDWVTMKCLEKDPTRRYAAVSDLAADIGRFLANEPVLARPPSVAYRLRKLVRRNRWRFVGGVLLTIGILSIASGAVIGWLGQERARRAARVLEIIASLDDARNTSNAIVPAWPANRGKLEQWLLDYATPIENLLRDRDIQLSDDVRAQLDSSSIRKMIDEVRARLEWTRTIEARSIRDHATEWDSTISRVGASSIYENVTLVPQVGLIPLGPDPASKHEEFLHVRSCGSENDMDRDGNGRLILTAQSGIVFVLLPGGTTRIGASTSEKDPHYDELAEAIEQPSHTVSLDPFFIAKHEVTQAQWMRLGDSENPSLYKPGQEPAGLPQITLLHPVESVSWSVCKELCIRYGLDLPTEAQWEYAARGDTTTKWWPGLTWKERRGAINVADKTVVEHGNSNWTATTPFRRHKDTYVLHAPVDTLRANPFGLHHMLGNVSEWCRDWYAPYSRPARPGDGLRDAQSFAWRSGRGGSYRYPLENARVSDRKQWRDGSIHQAVGLRPVRKLFRVPPRDQR